ncbi:Homeobox domain-containing protein [Heracleum sosnowskyi]|uniref:Homeobox domain-containing protein n=1 Tax=Heracleum sosnowskyi TaxID=360622 RepID=A0AAD8I0F1_9APIA|nr:Homeobox domain-containing protein [Heracleum sosnowskyi]
MDNDIFGAPVDMVYQNPVAGSGNVLSSTLVSFLQSHPHDLNNQNQIMAGFPALSVMQGEATDELHGVHQLTTHAGFDASNTLVVKSSQLDRNLTGNTSICTPGPSSNKVVENQFMAGMPMSTTSLTTLLAGRYGHHDNLNEIERLGYSGHHREVPEILSSNEYADIVQSWYGASVDYGNDVMLGNVSCRWDSHKFSAPQSAGTVPQRTGLEAYQNRENMDHNGWTSSENNNMSSNNTSDSSKYSNGLSLSLLTSQPATIGGTTIVEHCSGMSGSNFSRQSLHRKQLGMEQTSYNSKNLSSTSGKKPVQLSDFLSGTRFLNEMQEILAEIARYSLGNLSYPTSRAVPEENSSFSFDPSSGRRKTVMGPAGNDLVLCEQEAAAKKKHLINLLDMVDNRYNQSLDEIHKVISAFHAVTELDPQIHARFALRTISLSYQSLRERISNYILSIGAHVNEEGSGEEEKSFETSFIQKQWALQQLRQKDHQLWRPQRGLPERSVSVLRAWMFQNFLHPYPKDSDKHLLAVKSGLTRSQVSNWFINARVRLWKPMIDEMYSEMNRRKACQKGEEIKSTHRNHFNIDCQRFRMI